MPVEETKRCIPGEIRLGLVAKVEDVAAAADDQKLDRTLEFGQPSRQATRFLEAGRAVAVAVHKKDRSSNGLRLPEREARRKRACSSWSLLAPLARRNPIRISLKTIRRPRPAPSASNQRSKSVTG